MHIATYGSAGIYNHDPKRARKLLLRKKQISEIGSQLAEKGLTLVPLRVYVKKHWAKVELGLGRGKRKYDKRRTIKEREQDREARRATQRFS